MAEPELHEVAWGLTQVASGQIVGKNSKRHWYVGPLSDDGLDRAFRLAALGPDRTLCGKLIPWTRVHSSNEGDCRQCLRVMRTRKPELPGARQVLSALSIADAIMVLAESNPDPPDGPPLFMGTRSEPGELTEDGFLRMANALAGVPRRYLVTGPTSGQVLAAAARPARCIHCLKPYNQGIRTTADADVCPFGCGRKLTRLGNGQTLVHTEGCEGGRDCPCVTALNQGLGMMDAALEDEPEPGDDKTLLLDAEAALVALTDACAGSCHWDGEGCVCREAFWPAVERARRLADG